MNCSPFFNFTARLQYCIFSDVLSETGISHILLFQEGLDFFAGRSPFLYFCGFFTLYKEKELFLYGLRLGGAVSAAVALPIFPLAAGTHPLSLCRHTLQVHVRRRETIDEGSGCESGKGTVKSSLAMAAISSLYKLWILLDRSAHICYPHPCPDIFDRFQWLQTPKQARLIWPVSLSKKTLEPVAPF